ncbi:RNA-binding domain-containing [Chlorella sorokiniana]|uniref:RNA-binding domain-containing n=1 Tax=Chlorella sorokiniana TaxID=3076 RepID=A0A2P6TTV3_CHLSO|nr:RNA-binding domain-containing [Chlorella sorokiniana]|eukprot:PRW57508.1 RNA-binding domain-containing [Chlorella sorokiniana]
MLPAVEISGLPATATYDELRAISGCASVVFSLPQPGAPPRCLAMFSSSEGAAAARELLNGSEWGPSTLTVELVDNAVAWVAAEVPGYMPSRSSSTAAAAAPAAAPQPAARPPPPQPLPPAPMPQPQPLAAAEPPPHQPEDWLPNWDQSAGQTADWTEGYGDFWESEGEGQGGGEAGWQPVGAASSRPAGSHGAGSSSAQYGPPPVLSDVRLFIRNLDPEASQAALTRTFAKYGKLVQALKQPNRRFAHVQYARPDAAAAALAALHQKVVPELNKQGVLLVDYATPADDRGLGGRPSGSTSGGTVPKGGAYGIGSAPATGNPNISSTPTTCLWVGNLMSCATSDAIRAEFSKFGPLLQWQVAPPKLASSSNNLRYAIVSFRKLQDAQAAYEALNKQVVPSLGNQRIKLKYRTT